ncbi:MAG: hypothetical protein A2007_06390 [Verrucomicrobia bacterium GWC2_42_7]|nr:MAG: hypothetical protein A2007_06390 [Verrucomicrobia bacterium GWC2_42_7]
MELVKKVSLLSKFIIITSVVSTIFMLMGLQEYPVGFLTEEHAHIITLIFWLTLFFLIPFAIWIYRIVHNCRTMDESFKWTPWWSIFYCAIPIINLYKPYQVLKSIWITSSRAVKEEEDLRLVKWAWGLRLGLIILGIFGSFAYAFDLAENFRKLPPFLLLILLILNDFFTIACTFFTIKLVSNISRKQTLFIAQYNENEQR